MKNNKILSGVCATLDTFSHINARPRAWYRKNKKYWSKQYNFYKEKT